MKKSVLSLACTLPLAFALTAAGQVVFEDDLSSGANWVIAGDADTAATFGYDYSADGVPAAPNGADTIGLKMEANITLGVPAEIAAVRSLTFDGAPFRLQFDLWTNFSIQDASATEFSGASVGHNGAASGLDAASLIVTGDGGASRDYRLYKNKDEQFFASLQYNPALASNNGADPLFMAAFPGEAAPIEQGQAGLSDAGDSAFQWITVTVDVDPNAILQGITNDPGTAAFSLFSHETGTLVEVGTIDNSNGGTVVNMDGSVALVYADLFGSLAGDPQLQFAIFDNVVVSNPEPPLGGMPEITEFILDGNDIVLAVDAPKGATFRIATSTDLSTWIPLDGHSGLSPGTFRLVNVLGQPDSSGRRFYRAEED